MVASGEGAYRLGRNGGAGSSLQAPALFFLLALSAACSAAPRDAQAPPPAAEAAPAPATEPPEGDATDPGGAETTLSPEDRARHVEDALREIEIAERSLETSLVTPRPRKPKGPQVVPQPVPPGPKAPNGEPVSADCETACVALRSMQRSAAYVCKLTGPGDHRCERAERRVRAAREKIVRAACSCPEPLAARERRPWARTFTRPARSSCSMPAITHLAGSIATPRSSRAPGTR
jgi:hypothetical protein